MAYGLTIGQKASSPLCSCESYIRKVVQAAEPTPAQKAGAERSHRYLREILATGQFAGRILATYLSGSYARDTAIQPLDDVDIVFLVDPTKWSINYIFSYPPAATVLESFAAAIRYRYDQSPVRTQRRSVRLQLYHLDIDVVPAQIKTEGTDFIRIPDRKENRWITSAPQFHTKVAVQLNRKLDGRFKPLVKLVKLWNSRLPSTVQIKSFAVETIAARLFASVTPASLQEGLSTYFAFLAGFGASTMFSSRNDLGISLGYWNREVPDIANTGSNLIANVGYEQAQKFIGYAARSAERLREANSTYRTETAMRRINDALRI